MNYQALAFWFSFVQWIFTLAIALYVFFSNRQKATTKEIQKLDGRLDEHQDRLTRAEERLKQLPGSGETNRLSVQMQKLDGDIGRLREEISGVRSGLKPFTASVSRIEDYLLKGGGR